jgi:hypothetical protein
VAFVARHGSCTRRIKSSATGRQKLGSPILIVSRAGADEEISRHHDESEPKIIAGCVSDGVHAGCALSVSLANAKLALQASNRLTPDANPYTAQAAHSFRPATSASGRLGSCAAWAVSECNCFPPGGAFARARGRRTSQAIGRNSVGPMRSPGLPMARVQCRLPRHPGCSRGQGARRPSWRVERRGRGIREVTHWTRPRQPGVAFWPTLALSVLAALSSLAATGRLATC